jgi:hypothetical protein
MTRQIILLRTNEIQTLLVIEKKTRPSGVENKNKRKKAIEHRLLSGPDSFLQPAHSNPSGPHHMTFLYGF